MDFLKEMTRSLGFALRKFEKTTCSAFQTNELPREEAARSRRKAKAPMAKAAKSLAATTRTGQAGKSSKKSEAQHSRLKKVFNLFTYKISALGEYIWAISLYGTTDGYSTQIVSFISFQT